jgi:hypothetical protein
MMRGGCGCDQHQDGKDQLRETHHVLPRNVSACGRLDSEPALQSASIHTLASMYDYSGRHLWLRLKAAF